MRIGCININILNNIDRYNKLIIMIENMRFDIIGIHESYLNKRIFYDNYIIKLNNNSLDIGIIYRRE